MTPDRASPDRCRGCTASARDWIGCPRSGPALRGRSQPRFPRLRTDCRYLPGRMIARSPRWKRRSSPDRNLDMRSARSWVGRSRERTQAVPLSPTRPSSARDLRLCSHPGRPSPWRGYRWSEDTPSVWPSHCCPHSGRAQPECRMMLLSRLGRCLEGMRPESPTALRERSARDRLGCTRPGRARAGKILLHMESGRPRPPSGCNARVRWACSLRPRTSRCLGCRCPRCMRLGMSRPECRRNAREMRQCTRIGRCWGCRCPSRKWSASWHRGLPHSTRHRHRCRRYALMRADSAPGCMESGRRSPLPERCYRGLTVCMRRGCWILNRGCRFPPNTVSG